MVSARRIAVLAMFLGAIWIVGSSPVQAAPKNQHAKFVKMLQRGANVNPPGFSTSRGASGTNIVSSLPLNQHAMSTAFQHRSGGSSPQNPVGGTHPRPTRNPELSAFSSMRSIPTPVNRPVLITATRLELSQQFLIQQLTYLNSIHPTNTHQAQQIATLEQQLTSLLRTVDQQLASPQIHQAVLQQVAQLQQQIQQDQQQITQLDQAIASNPRQAPRLMVFEQRLVQAESRLQQQVVLLNRYAVTPSAP